jgi:hypothetical protein
VILVKKIMVVLFALILATSLAFAAEKPTVKATEPVGAVVETSGVIIGKVTNAIEKSLGGGKTQGSLVMADESGKTKIIPLDDTVKVLDKGFHAVTLNQLKGRKVAVEVSEKGGTATKVQEIQ